MKRPLSEEGYELTLGTVEEPVVEVAPQPEPATPREWLRRNLFSSPTSGVLTVVTAAIIVWILFHLGRWIFSGADWTVVKANLRAYMVGRFPLEEVWRVWTDVYLVLLLAGLSRGVYPREAPSRAAFVVRAVLAAAAIGVVLYLVESELVFLLVAGGIGVHLVGLFLGGLAGRRLRVPLLAAWVLAFPVIVVVLRGFDGVKPEQWGGLLLNLIVAVVAIFLSFPIGILLALGRRSTLPMVRTFCVGFIELIRGVPLVTLIFFGLYILPLLLSPGMDLPNIVLAIIVFTLFSSVYVAEITRGGLQGVHTGQYEAGRALGLSPTRMMTFVILPQALRSTIPTMIGHFISLFKDTSLLAALGIFTELLSVASRATRLEFAGEDAEALVAAGFIFWVFAFSMAKWSQRVERRVGVGER